MRSASGVVAVSTEPLSPHERGLIEQARKVNKLLSLYVLAIQERKSLSADEYGGLARALRSVADVIEREGRRAPDQLPSSAEPVIDGSIGDAKPDGPTAEA
jgi:hypothetical protein